VKGEGDGAAGHRASGAADGDARRPRAWVLAIEASSGDPARRVGGLSLVLRLALDAQAAGATGLVLRAPVARELLADARLRLPLLDAVPEGTRLVRAPATLLAHRRLLASLAERDDAGDGERDLAAATLEDPPPWYFAPVDVLDRPSARRAERLLFRSLRKPQDGWTSRWLNRHVSLAISRVLARTPLTPNQVSVAILGVGVAAALFAARGDAASLLCGAALFQVQSVLDGCDGELSRVTHRGSLFGQWLDTIGDDVTNYGFFAGAAWGLWRATGAPAYLVAGAITVGCGLLASGLEYRYLVRIGSGDLLAYPLSQGGGGRLGWLQPLFKRDTFVALTLVAAAVGLLGPMLFVFAAAAIGIAIGVVRTELRLARER
jgi:phosphatidylglycerophosphate synthase